MARSKGSLVSTRQNKTSNGQVRGIALPTFTELNSVKSHLNTDPKQYSKFQNPTSSNSLDIMLTKFSYSYNTKVWTGGITQSIFYRIRSKVNQVI